MTTRRSAVFATVALAAVAANAPPPVFPGAASPITVGTTPPGLAGTRPQDCGACHVEIAREWRESLHARSYRDDVFQDSYAREHRAFCVHCHAPLHAPGAEPDALAADDGISCSICHVRDAHVLGAGSARGDAPTTTRAHPVLAASWFDTSEHCAGCHQFDFPDGVTGARRSYAEPMQNTLAEWQSTSPATGGSCQSCHMPTRVTPSGQRYRSHDFATLTDAAMMARAVHVEISSRREHGDLVVRARVTPGAIGHAFPTGDLMRQAELRVWLNDDESTTQSSIFTRLYGVERARGPGGVEALRHQIGDTRIPPPGAGAERVVTFHWRFASTARVAWALDHLRMPESEAAMHGFLPDRNRTPVAHGSFIAPLPQRESRANR